MSVGEKAAREMWFFLDKYIVMQQQAAEICPSKPAPWCLQVKICE